MHWLSRDLGEGGGGGLCWWVVASYFASIILIPLSLLSLSLVPACRSYMSW